MCCVKHDYIDCVDVKSIHVLLNLHVFIAASIGARVLFQYVGMKFIRREIE